MNFSYLDLNFSVRSDQADDLKWLIEFLQPGFTVGSADNEADVRVLMQVDRAGFEALYRRGPGQPDTRVDAFTLDNQTIVLPAWNGPEGFLTLYEDKFELFFIVSHDRRQVRLLARRGPAYRTPLMRVLREYSMNHAMQTGGVFLHASAVSLDGQGLLTVGTKGAGKTSLMSHFLRNCAARYVANDRVYLNPDSVPLTMQGMPTIATLRSGMIPLFPRLGEQVAASRYHHHLTLEECSRREQRLKPWDNGKYGLTPAQLMRLHGSRATTKVQPRAMLFPRVVNDVSATQDALRAIPLGAGEVARRVPDALFGARTLRNRAEVFSLHGPGLPNPEVLLGRASRITQKLPCFEVRLSEGAYRNPAASDRLLREVLG
jgi:hypothetical protein